MTRLGNNRISHMGQMGRLADIACEFSSVQEWQNHISNALSILRAIIPSDTVVLGISFQDWQIFISPEPADPTDISSLVLRYYKNLTEDIDSEHDNPHLETGQSGSFISIPVLGTGEAIGVLQIRNQHPRAYAPEDMSVLTVVSSMIGAYITNLRDNADLEAAYKREHRIADVLQRALAPELSLKLSNCEITGRIWAAHGEADVGGDFYDIFSIGGKRYALVVGDVLGKGLDAAVYTAMTKYMIRGYACEDPEPASVLSRLNETVSKFMPEEMFVTLFYGLLDTLRGTLEYGSAGHEPPIFYDPKAGVIFDRGPTGPAIRITIGADYNQRSIAVTPGTVVVVCTDGITEAKDETEQFGIKGIADVISANTEASANDIADSILDAVFQHSEGALHDDALVLVIKA